MALRQGAQHVHAAQERAKNRQSNVDTNWFYWRDGDEKVLRFLTDMNEIFTVYVHERIKGKDGKDKNFVCRREFHGCPESEKEPCPHTNFCELCSSSNDDIKYRAEVSYGLAVLRQEEMGEEDGEKKIVGYNDVTYEIEVEENGKKVKKIAPWVGIVSQKISNFWSYIDAVQRKYGSLKNYDVAIERKGGDQKTAYMPFYLPPVEIPDIEERYAKYLPDLKGYLERIGSQAYYDKQLRGIEPEKKEGDSPSGSEQSKTTDASDDQTEFDRLKAEQAKLSDSASTGTYN